MRKLFRKILSLCVAFGCTLGAGIFVSCMPLGGGESSSSSGTLSGYAVSCTVIGGAQVNAPSRAEAGETVGLVIQLESGYYLRKIVVNGQEITSASFIMPACDVTVEVYTANEDTAYAVSATQSQGGVISPAVSQAKRGDTVTANVTANAGYRLQKIYANGVELSFTETQDFCYTVKALMQDTELVFTADYAENPVLNDEYGYAIETTSSHASYWKARYLDDGIFFSVLVKDDNVIRNGRLEVEARDFVEFRICPETEKESLENANALRCLVTADGTFYLQKCLGADDYALSGLGVNYEYGENFTTETYLCTKTKNRFDGYAVEVFLGYELFGLTRDEALGKMTFAPAINDTLYTDGKKDTGGIVWNSAEIVMTNANAETFFTDGYKCSLANPATYLGVAQDGGVYARTVGTYENAEYLFLGDDTFASARWTAFSKSIVGAKAYTVGFAEATTATFTSQAALDFVNTIRPETVVFGIGQNDLETGASVSTAASRLITLLKTYHEILPQAKLVWNMLNDSEVNAQIKAFAGTVEYVTVIEQPYTEETTVENCDTYIANVCKALELETPLSQSAVFGDAKYGTSSVGWTVDTQTATLELTGREDDGKKYAYFAGVASTDLFASASFAAGDVYNGDETPSFGLVLASGTQYLYFYVTETYAEGELMKKQVGYTLVTDGEITASGTISPSLYYRDGERITLAVDKTANGIELYVGGYKAFTLTGAAICEAQTETSVGVYAENIELNVQSATVTDREV